MKLSPFSICACGCPLFTLLALLAMAMPTTTAAIILSCVIVGLCAIMACVVSFGEECDSFLVLVFSCGGFVTMVFMTMGIQVGYRPLSSFTSLVLS
jgi:hypothetical protein